MLLSGLLAADILIDQQLEAELLAPVKQQMVDSGLLASLQQVMEATAEQLERCTAAAAATAAADDVSVCSAAAVSAVASSPTAAAAAASSGLTAAQPMKGLALVQLAANKLLELPASLTSYLSVLTKY
jgi:hypothetical protein